MAQQNFSRVQNGLERLSPRHDSLTFLSGMFIDRFAADAENVINQDVPDHEADRVWAALMPYFWEQCFLKAIRVAEPSLPFAITTGDTSP